MFRRNVNSRDQIESNLGRVVRSWSPFVIRRKTSSTAANTAAPASTLNAPMRIIECFIVDCAISSVPAPLSASSGVPASFEEMTHAMMSALIVTQPVTMAALRSCCVGLRSRSSGQR